MLEGLPESLRTQAPWSGIGIAGLAAGFIAASIWAGVPAPLWVTTASAVLIAWAVWIDVERFRLPDGLTVPLFAVAMANGALGGQDAFVAAVFGAVLGYSVMRLAGLYMDWRLGSQFMMFGDAKFMAGLGGLVGWEGLAGVLLIGSLSGLVEGGLRLVLGRARNERGVVAFGPHLAIGFVVVWLLGYDGFLALWLSLGR